MSMAKCTEMTEIHPLTSLRPERFDRADILVDEAVRQAALNAYRDVGKGIVH